MIETSNESVYLTEIATISVFRCKLDWFIVVLPCQSPQCFYFLSLLAGWFFRNSQRNQSDGELVVASKCSVSQQQTCSWVRRISHEKENHITQKWKSTKGWTWQFFSFFCKITKELTLRRLLIEGLQQTPSQFQRSLMEGKRRSMICLYALLITSVWPGCKLRRPEVKRAQDQLVAQYQPKHTRIHSEGGGWQLGVNAGLACLSISAADTCQSTPQSLSAKATGQYVCVSVLTGAIKAMPSITE